MLPAPGCERFILGRGVHHVVGGADTEGVALALGVLGNADRFGCIQL
jgi:hypothetical protein